MSGVLSDRCTKTPEAQGYITRHFVDEGAHIKMHISTTPRKAVDINDSEQEIDFCHEPKRSQVQTGGLARDLTHSEWAPVSQLPTFVNSGPAEGILTSNCIQEASHFTGRDDRSKTIASHSEIQVSKDKSHASSARKSAGTPLIPRSEMFSDDISEPSDYVSDPIHDTDGSNCYFPPPAGPFELSPSFYPEWYAVDSLFKDPLFVISERCLDNLLWTKEYFVLYAETPRQWRKLTVLATVEGFFPGEASISGADISHDSEQQDIALPQIIQECTMRHLSQTSQFTAVTNLSLHFEQDENGLLLNNQTKSSFRQNYMEACSSGEDRILRDIEDLGCKKFSESEIITQSRKSSSCFIVRVGSRTCIERKAPFVSSGMRGANGFQNFFDDLKFLKSLRRCSGVAEFFGVVLDKTEKHLMSYIFEHPALGTVMSLFLGAYSNREIVPWIIRENWARQLVGAVADIHSGIGCLVGGLCWLDEIGVRADGTIILTAPRASQRYFNRGRGMLAPELRGIPGTSSQTLEKMAQKYSLWDIFYGGSLNTKLILLVVSARDLPVQADLDICVQLITRTRWNCHHATRMSLVISMISSVNVAPSIRRIGKQHVNYERCSQQQQIKGHFQNTI